MRVSQRHNLCVSLRRDADIPWSEAIGDRAEHIRPLTALKFNDSRINGICLFTYSIRTIAPSNCRNELRGSRDKYLAYGIFFKTDVYMRGREDEQAVTQLNNDTATAVMRNTLPARTVKRNNRPPDGRQRRLDC